MAFDRGKVEAAGARSILEKRAIVRIIDVVGDKVRIKSQNQVDGLQP